LSEPDKGKFWRYAIGEVLLVVIGILIALQIDNWKDQRANRTQEAYYVQRLLDEFASNDAEADRNIRFSTFQRDNAALLLKSLNAELDEQEQRGWFHALNQTWFLPHTNYNETTWNELKTTGKLELISNRNLVKAINSFYSNVAYEYKLEEEWGEFNLRYRQVVNNILEDDLRVKILAGTGQLDIEKPLDHPVDTHPYIEKLSQIPRIQGQIRDIWINREVGEQHHKQLKVEIGQIVELLRSEAR